MNRLILASNRLPVAIRSSEGEHRVERSVGGLATALQRTHESQRGTWVGWPGPSDRLGAAERAAVDGRLAHMRMRAVHLSAEETAGYYGDFSNGLLWPVLHSVMGALPLEPKGWAEYETVNARFADAVVSEYRENDGIWVHDYQLMLVPALVRQQLPGARIGFFLHVPFPSPELYATLPNRERLLQGLLGADVIGFHTEAYRRNFEEALQRHLTIEVRDHAVVLPRRAARISVFPVGVDAPEISGRASASDVQREVEALRGDGSCRLMVGIDRLDYTKGIARRLLAFRQLLRRRPEWLGRVRLIQIAVPSRGEVRAYRRLKEEVETLVGRINGELATVHWTPVHYLFRGIPHAQLLALYRAADTMLVTPVRDGMNLVAKEFVAARSDLDGVLVLSEFAGAAAELHEAVMVNPYDLEAVAHAYERALLMSRSERRARMARLRERVFARTARDWSDGFVEALGSEEAATVREGLVA